MATKLKYWIKERYNPQSGVYFVARGQITSKEAKAIENDCIYGYNKMHSFSDEHQYLARLEELKAEGKRVQ